MKIINWLKQLFPLTYRQLYFSDRDGCYHFAVWKSWFGHIYKSQDYVVIRDAAIERKCIEAVVNGEFTVAADMLVLLAETDFRRTAYSVARIKGALPPVGLDNRCNCPECAAQQPGPCDDPIGGDYIVSQESYNRLVDGAPGLVIPGQLYIPLFEPVGFRPDQTRGDEPQVCNTWMAFVVQLTHKLASDITDEDAMAAGYYDAEACRSSLPPGLVNNPLVTIIYTKQN